MHKLIEPSFRRAGGQRFRLLVISAWVTQQANPVRQGNMTSEGRWLWNGFVGGEARSINRSLEFWPTSCMQTLVCPFSIHLLRLPHNKRPTEHQGELGFACTSGGRVFPRERQCGRQEAVPLFHLQGRRICQLQWPGQQTAYSYHLLQGLPQLQKPPSAKFMPFWCCPHPQTEECGGWKACQFSGWGSVSSSQPRALCQPGCGFSRPALQMHFFFGPDLLFPPLPQHLLAEDQVEDQHYERECEREQRKLPAQQT